MKMMMVLAKKMIMITRKDPRASSSNKGKKGVAWAQKGVEVEQGGSWGSSSRGLGQLE